MASTLRDRIAAAIEREILLALQASETPLTAAALLAESDAAADCCDIVEALARLVNSWGFVRRVIERHTVAYELVPSRAADIEAELHRLHRRSGALGQMLAASQTDRIVNAICSNPGITATDAGRAAGVLHPHGLICNAMRDGTPDIRRERGADNVWRYYPAEVEEVSHV